MSVEVIGKAVRTQELISVIEPTIFIGLGGTGKEILLRLRQRFLERHNVIGYPILGYLWIDMDTRDINLIGQNLDYIQQEIHFRPDEVINAQIQSNEFLNYFQNATAYPHIFRWLYPKLATMASTPHGPRAIRALGRLGFFHSIHRIQQRLGALAIMVRTQENWKKTQDNYGIHVGRGLNVIILSSLAGGTGSGMFLDMAFYCRHRLQNLAPDIVGYLLLPSVFAPDEFQNKAMYANAYASLKELQFYTMRKDFSNSQLAELSLQQGQSESRRSQGPVLTNEFEVEWIRGNPLKVPGPPFDTCYLVDNQTTGGGLLTPEKKTDLFDMIAENIFVDYTSYAFAAKKRSVRANLGDYLVNQLTYGYLDIRGNRTYTQTFPCSFSAFGFSKLFVPVDRIRTACSYRLAIDLVDQFIRGNQPQRNLNEEFRRNELRHLGLRVEDFLTLEAFDDASQTYSAAIRSAWLGRQRALLAEAEGSELHMLPTLFIHQFEKYSEEMFADPQDPERCGLFLRRLRLENHLRFRKDAESRIVNGVKHWLDDPRLRFDLALKYLSFLNVILLQHSEDFRRKVARWAGEAKRLSDDINVLVTFMQAESEGWWVHRRAMVALLKEACTRASDHFQARMLAEVYTNAAEICDELRAYIGSQTTSGASNGAILTSSEGLVQVLVKLHENLGRLRDVLDRKLQAIEHLDEHLVFENLYVQGMFRKFYMLQRDDRQWVKVDLGVDELQLREIETAYRQFTQLTTLLDLSQRFEQAGSINVERELTKFTLMQFENLEVRTNALKTLYETHANQDRLEYVIDRFVRNGSPWVAPSGLGQIDSAIRNSFAEGVELGLSDAGEANPHFEKFVARIRELSSAHMTKAVLGAPVDVQPESIYFYTEVAGLALLYLNRLDQYKAAYLQRLSEEESHHIMPAGEGFEDILPVSDMQIEETIYIHGILFIGMILRVVEVSKDSMGNVIYSFDYVEAATVKRIVLGRNYTAVEALRHNKGWLDCLQRRVIAIQEKLSLDSRKQFLTVLVYHVMDGTTELPGLTDSAGRPAKAKEGPFAPRFIPLGNQIIEHFSLEYQAVARVVSQEAQSLARQLNCRQSKINDMVLELYPSLDVFSEELLVSSARLRRLIAPTIVHAENLEHSAKPAASLREPDLTKKGSDHFEPPEILRSKAMASIIQEKIAAGDFDVFLCHNSVDKPAVKEIAERLKTNGILPWLDEWNLRPGTPWQAALEEQIQIIKSAAVFVGPNGLGPWHDLEQAAFLRQFVKRRCPVIPVVLPDTKDTPKLPVFLEGMTWVDFRKKDPDPMEQLIWGITGKRSSNGC
jgi:hypothetical protein